MRQICLLLLGLSWTRAVVAQDTVGSVSGIVRDELGQPIVDALVVIDAESTSQRTRTDASGRFRFTSVSIGRHELDVVRLGFAPHRSTIEVGTVELGLTIELQTVPVRLDTIAVQATRPGLYGTVATRGMELLPHAPRPLRGVTVEILDTPHRTSTDGDGRFRVEQLGEGSYSILVRLDRYASRMVPVYVPPAGGVDVTIVLDSTVAEYQRRDDFILRDISRRLREATNPSALIGLHELAAPDGTTLKDALRVAPSALSRGLVLKDDVTCVYIDGKPQPRMTAADIVASDVQTVEVYGTFARGGTMTPPGPWPLGGPCGSGMRQSPGEHHRTDAYNVARVIVVWMKRGR
ncbi:MAG TPA: carboxypeptidase-like regulatory domain-containing protein [Gemmatimonadaceae bacterium]